MRVVATLAVLASVAVGLLSWLTVQSRTAALGTAQVHTAQAVRVQTVATDLAQADAVATNGFLHGGLETPAQRAAYDAAVARAATTLAAAVAARPEGGVRLGRANEAVTRYLQVIATARALNRQNLPIGAAFLQQGTIMLRTEVVTDLSGLVGDENAAAQRELDRADQLGWVLAGVAVVAVGVLVVAQYWLARRTHRVFNLPFAFGSLALVLALLAAVSISAWSSVRAGGVRAGPGASTSQLAELRLVAYQARSAESMALIRRGTGAEFETAFRAHLDRALRLEEALARSGVAKGGNLARNWQGAHQEIRRLDDAGDWEGAVTKATDEAGRPSRAFEALATTSSVLLGEQATATATGIRDAQAGSIPVAWASLLAGLLSAVCAVWGTALRLQEYR
jgi:hypothetical protein